MSGLSTPLLCSELTEELHICRNGWKPKASILLHPPWVHRAAQISGARACTDIVSALTESEMPALPVWPWDLQSHWLIWLVFIPTDVFLLCLQEVRTGPVWFQNFSSWFISLNSTFHQCWRSSLFSIISPPEVSVFLFSGTMYHFP